MKNSANAPPSQTNSCGALTTPIVLLTATLPDRAELLRRALESVLKQSVLPDHAVLVSDAARATDVAPLTFAHPAVGLHCLVNQSAPGAANTWNVGIRYVARHWPDCYIAMLDDDDEWDSDHLATCSMQAHRASWPDAVISGLRMVQNGVEHYRPPVHRVTEKEFLVGNPGWQGSNTFIRCSTVVSAGAFTPGLQSCNDRDLAIRVLALPGVRIAFTCRHTATWHLDNSRISLSAKNNPRKLDGLAFFYILHEHRMTADIKSLFFERAETVFGWRKEDITVRAKEHRDAAVCTP